MHSYEDRIRAIELYYRYGKKASVVVMALGYPSTKQLSSWVRVYEEKGDLPRELKPRERYSRAQKIAAVEHYLTHGGCLSYTRRAIGYPSNEILVSRAKQRIYVIGERALWEKQPYFSTLSRALGRLEEPVSNSNPRSMSYMEE